MRQSRASRLARRIESGDVAVTSRSVQLQGRAVPPRTGRTAAFILGALADWRRARTSPDQLERTRRDQERLRNALSNTD